MPSKICQVWIFVWYQTRFCRVLCHKDSFVGVVVVYDDDDDQDYKVQKTFDCSDQIKRKIVSYNMIKVIKCYGIK